MSKMAKSILRALIAGIVLNASFTAGWTADTCPPQLRRKLPVCASWQHEPSMGIEIKNNCDFQFAYLIDLGNRSNQPPLGKVASGEIVLEAMELGQYKVRNVYCCAAETRC